MLADDRAHPLTIHCELGVAGSQVRFACTHITLEHDELGLQRFDDTTWPALRHDEEPLAFTVPDADSMRFSPDGTRLARWNQYQRELEIIDIAANKPRPMTNLSAFGDVRFLDDTHLLIRHDDPRPDVHPATLETVPGSSRTIPYGGKPFVVGNHLWIAAPLGEVFDLPWP